MTRRLRVRSYLPLPSSLFVSLVSFSIFLDTKFIVFSTICYLLSVVHCGFQFTFFLWAWERCSVEMYMILRMVMDFSVFLSNFVLFFTQQIHNQDWLIFLPLYIFRKNGLYSSWHPHWSTICFWLFWSFIFPLKKTQLVSCKDWIWKLIIIKNSMGRERVCYLEEFFIPDVAFDFWCVLKLVFVYWRNG